MKSQLGFLYPTPLSPLRLNKKPGMLLAVREALPMSPERGGSCGLVEKEQRALFTLPGQLQQGPSGGESQAPGRGWRGGERNQAEELRFDLNHP